MPTTTKVTKKTGSRTRMSKVRRHLAEVFGLVIAQLFKDPKAKVAGAIVKLDKLNGLSPVDGVFRIDDEGTGLFPLAVCFFPSRNDGKELQIGELTIAIPEAVKLRRAHPFREDTLGQLHRFALTYELTPARVQKLPTL